MVQIHRIDECRVNSGLSTTQPSAAKVPKLPRYHCTYPRPLKFSSSSKGASCDYLTAQWKLGFTVWHVIGSVPPYPVSLASSPPETATHRPRYLGLSAARSPFLVETLQSPERREPVRPQLSPSYPPLRVLGASDLHCPPAFTCRNAITSQRLLPKLAASPTTNDSAC